MSRIKKTKQTKMEMMDAVMEIMAVMMGLRGATITCHNSSALRGEFFWSDMS